MNDRLHFSDVRFSHRTDIQPRFADFDAFGHVNNNAWMAYFDLGKSAFFDSIMGCRCTPDRLGAVIVNINVDFLAPALIDERLEVRTAVVALGERSFRLYQRIVGASTDEVKAQALTVLAGFDPVNQNSAPLNEALRNALAAHLV